MSIISVIFCYSLVFSASETEAEKQQISSVFSVNPDNTGTELNGQPFLVVGLRMSNALVSDEKTQELIDNMDLLASYGINSFSVFFQGSRFGDIKGYNEDGTLSAIHAARMGQIIEAANSRGMVILVGCFYYSNSKAKWKNWGQAEANNAIANTVRWLKGNNYRNVFIDVNNEHMAKYDDSQLIAAGKSVDASYVIATSGRETPDNAGLSLHHGSPNIPGKYYIESEGTGGGYWGDYSKREGLYNYINIGIYTDEMKRGMLDYTDRFVKRGQGFMFASTWLQCPPPRGPNHTPGGMGTSDDPGVKWWLEHIKSLRSQPDVPHRGMQEITLTTSPEFGNPYFDVDLKVIFTRPDGSEVTVEGFYDGDNTFKVRAYCDAVGNWRWRSTSKNPGLNDKSGSFLVIPSTFKGKLRKHPQDSRQFAYDNGEWFLHIGDTGYRYVTSTEPKWKEYIDQAAQMGATKIRTWFCQGRSDVQILFADDRKELNLPYWQEIDRRLIYALKRHPHVIFKLIPYGEDTEELRRYGAGDRMSKLIASYAQARFSALPNIIWCVSNDRDIVREANLTGRQVHYDTISQIAQDMAAREPWGTLLTNHQSRFNGYSFVNESWSDIITIEDIDQVDGRIILEYRDKGDDPVINDEDRYEQYRNPQHDRYFFRRLMWGSLLSGGHATYGGLNTFEDYDGDLRGVQGYYDAVEAGKLERGADDFVHIHKFFADAKLTLVNMTPDDSIVGDDAGKWKCVHNTDTFIVYLANPTGDTPETDNAAETIPDVTIQLPEGNFAVEWFDPATGVWQHDEDVNGGEKSLTAPDKGDWVLLLRLAL